MRRARAALAAALVFAVAGCAGGIVPPSASGSRLPVVPRTNTRPAPQQPATPGPVLPSTLRVPGGATSAGMVVGPDVASLNIAPDVADRALRAFRLSCPALLRRTDTSGMSSGTDWVSVCAAANGATQGKSFFETQFATLRVGTGQAYATGYYEPDIAGSRTRGPGYTVPVYARPADLIEVDLGQFGEALKGKTIRGRVVGGKLVPYFDRGEIDDGALAGTNTPIAWAADGIEFFFLQIQGSGRLVLPDGQVMRIGYDGQNGRDYVGIGGLMRDRGLVGAGQLSMQGIMAWLRANPEQGRAVMRENKSFVFFKEITGPGPRGALGVAVTGGASVAADPAFVPLGAPVWLDLDRAEADGLWIAQDTGGAIKGANRFDTFWGAGGDARRIAGGMSGRGQALILVPIAVAQRVAGAAPPAP